MIDSDLARLYGVEAKNLNKAVKRNKNRFPPDFMFQLTRMEFRDLRCQIGTSRWGGRRFLPYAFTENGVAMLSSVLNSARAIDVNIRIMRAFTKIREWLATHQDLQEKLRKLERKFDRKFSIVFHAIQQLLEAPERPIRVRGFGEDGGKG